MSVPLTSKLSKDRTQTSTAGCGSPTLSLTSSGAAPGRRQFLSHSQQRWGRGPAGAIFTESAYNSTTMEDPVTVAYGHQMHAGTMFGKLQETYSQENALEDYGEVIVYLPEKELHYQVFAAVPYDNRHILYNYDCTDSRRFNAFLNSIYEVRRSAPSLPAASPSPLTTKCWFCPPVWRATSQRRYLVLAVCQAEID